ncbi:hypothetical protein TWF506_008231 [Arthrobotrys conoides]|uniref:Uncharacterized protein n=1 Tax=Arthrobotrys conoides TaxID=74498 RepID=A0AAN8NE63_9PEZI
MNIAPLLRPRPLLPRPQLPFGYRRLNTLLGPPITTDQKIESLNQTIKVMDQEFKARIIETEKEIISINVQLRFLNAAMGAIYASGILTENGDPEMHSTVADWQGTCWVPLGSTSPS